MEKPSSKVMVIEVTVISAEGLRVSKKQPVKKNVSVTVRSDPFDSRSTGQVDCPDRCPAWNHKMHMDLPLHARFLTVEACSGGRVIGTANIPVTDFAGGILPENYLSFLSYRLRDGVGGRNGIVNLSVKVVKGSPPAAGGDRACAASCSRPWMGAPVADKNMSGGVVTGYPVPYSY